MAMSDLNNDLFEEMLNDYLPEEKKSGDVISGIITRKDMDFAYLDLSGKQEGRILIREVEDFNVGDTIEVKVLRSDEEFVIVSKFLLDKAKEFASYEVDEIVSGTILKKVKGGYSVRVGKNEAFLPFSLASLERDKDYTGEKFKFLIKEKGRNNLTVSRTDLVKKEELDYFSSVNVGDIVEGKVKEVLDFGVILELGPTTGFIHVSEVSWDQVSDLIEKFGINDVVKAKVIEKDEEKRKIKLSLKQLEVDPWVEFKNTHNVGDVIKGTVKEILDFGLVVDLSRNKGFVHISELAWNNAAKVLKEFKEGDVIEAKIINIDDEKKNIKLSVKQLTENPWDSVKEKYSIGDVLERPIAEIFEFGLLVELEKDKGIEVFIHRNEFSWDKNEHLEYKLGDEVEFKIIHIDKAGKKIGGSIKQLTISPWKEAAEQYKVGNKVVVPITSIQENFALVKLTDRFDGIIPKKELTEEFLKDISEKFSVGDEVEAIVTELNEKKKSIILSVKKIQEIEESKEMEELMKKYGV